MQLEVTADDRVALARVRAYAESHRISHAALFAAVARPLGSTPESITAGHQCVISNGLISVGFTIEEQQEPMGWCRHVSLSICEDCSEENEGSFVRVVVLLLGYTIPQALCMAYLTENGKILNLFEPLDNPLKRIAAAQGYEIRIHAQKPEDGSVSFSA